MSFELRDYQEKFSKQGYEILKKHSCLILNMEVRTGKSHTVLDIGVNYNCDRRKLGSTLWNRN